MNLFIIDFYFRINYSKSGGSTKSSSILIRKYYESLEEFHVYVLANNIRRPIIIYSDIILLANRNILILRIRHPLTR